MISEKITAIIIAGNEEKNIRDCLESVKWCDEIVVVDSESTDKTVEIAREYTDNVFIKKWEGFSAQKRFALDKANNQWVISIDADERISPALKDEIIELLGNKEKAAGYFIPRENYFLDKAIKSCFWYPDYQLRLFRKEKTKVTDRKVHEGFVVDGETAKLKNDIIHYTHTTIKSALAKANEYSSLEAEEKFNKKKVKVIDIIIHPLAAFLNHFISRKGYKDGMYGFLVSVIHAITNLLTYIKIWELQNVRKK